MHPLINFLIRAGIVSVLINSFMVISIMVGPAAKYSSYTEPHSSTTIELTAPKADQQNDTDPIETAPPYDYTEEELEYLALVIYQEAGGDKCTDETRMMVGNVVMNRVADDRYPNTIYDVVTQKRQYGRLHWTGPVWPARASNETEAHAVERAYTIAERILQGERVLPADVIYQAEFPQGTEVVAHQDGFYFCR